MCEFLKKTRIHSYRGYITRHLSGNSEVLQNCKTSSILKDEQL